MFNSIVDEYGECDAFRTNFVMRPCESSPRHGDDCFSVFIAGTDTCFYSHITYEQAYQHVYGELPLEEEENT